MPKERLAPSDLQKAVMDYRRATGKEDRQEALKNLDKFSPSQAASNSPSSLDPKYYTEVDQRQPKKGSSQDHNAMRDYYEAERMEANDIGDDKDRAKRLAEIDAQERFYDKQMEDAERKPHIEKGSKTDVEPLKNNPSKQTISASKDIGDKTRATQENAKNKTPDKQKFTDKIKDKIKSFGAKGQGR